MSKRKIILLATALCLVAILAMGSTLAYFTADDSATNEFTAGNVQIDLTEPKWEEQGKGDAPEVYPGEALAKDPTVKNTGKNPCFVRISVTGWDCLPDPAGDITYRTDYVNGKLGDNWEYNEADGYYYYTKVLAANETTDALFDQIVIPLDLENDLTGTTYKLDVKAYAVQAQGALGMPWSQVNNPEVMTLDKIAAWFEISKSSEW